MSNTLTYFNNTPALTKNVLAIGIVGGVGYGVYRHFKNKDKKDNLKATEVLGNIQASQSGSVPSAIVAEIKKDIKKNVKDFTFTIAQYKGMADLLEQAMEKIPPDREQILQIFKNCKTRLDVLTITAYFAVRTYQRTPFADIEILNLYQWFGKMSYSSNLLNQINLILEKNKINFKF